MSKTWLKMSIDVSQPAYGENASSLGDWNCNTVNNAFYPLQVLSYFTGFISVLPLLSSSLRWHRSDDQLIFQITLSATLVRWGNTLKACVVSTPTVYLKQKLPREKHVWFLHVGVWVIYHMRPHQQSSAKRRDGPFFTLVCFLLLMQFLVLPGGYFQHNFTRRFIKRMSFLLVDYARQ